MTATYKVDGMTCGGCKKSVENALNQALPEAQIQVDLEGGKVQVVGDHTPQVVQSAVEDAGFDFGGEQPA
jgi:copper chaperone